MEEEKMQNGDVTEEERPTEAEQNLKEEDDDDEEAEEGVDEGPAPGFRLPPALLPEPSPSPVKLAVTEEERKVPCEVGPGVVADDDNEGPPPGYQFPAPHGTAPPAISNVGKALAFKTPPPPQPEPVTQLRAQPQTPPAYQFLPPPTMAPLPVNDVGKMPVPLTLQSPALVPHLTGSSHPPPGCQFPPPLEAAATAPVRDSATALPLQRPPPQPKAPAARPSAHPQPAVPRPHPQIRPPPAAPTYEMAQMVCGSCQRLLSYIRGARYVQCSCCQTVNFVLEEHQVGQIKCSSCSVLLMYPYGAPSVKCSSCYSMTEIGEHNKRPPWSVQQGRAPPSSSTVR